MVAYHLTESGIKLGLQPVIIGGERGAKRVFLEMAKHKCSATVISSDSTIQNDFATSSWLGWSPVALRGHGRVAALQVEREGVLQTIHCDAVILAGMLRPMRNIDGAVFDGINASSVSFVQLPSETAEEGERADFGRGAAASVFSKIEGARNEG
jgi:hypothetical protein